MTTHDDFIGRVKGLVISLEGAISSEECAEVEHLLDHGEVGEALRSLAWIIVEEKKRVPEGVIDAMYALADGLVPREHMPPTLRDHIA